MLLNSGKIFEGEIKESIKQYNKKVSDDFYDYKPTDSASGFGGKQEGLRFSAESPFDFLVWKEVGKEAPKVGILYFLELKSTATISIPFSLENNKANIKASQIKNLSRAADYGINAGFVLNFRKIPITYYLSIENFMPFANTTTKKSISLSDVESNGGVIIPQKLKKVKYIYDINILFEGEAK